MTQYEMVREFMQKFGQECPEKLGCNNDEVRKLRIKLIAEESNEAIDALNLLFEETNSDRQFINLFDALLDLHYVAYCGTAIAFGITEEQMKAGFEEVHRSNMSKLWTEQEVYEAQPNKECTMTEINTPDKRCFLVKDSNGKVIKSPSYSPANLAPILGL